MKLRKIYIIDRQQNSKFLLIEAYTLNLSLEVVQNLE